MQGSKANKPITLNQKVANPNPIVHRQNVATQKLEANKAEQFLTEPGVGFQNIIKETKRLNKQKWKSGAFSISWKEKSGAGNCDLNYYGRLDSVSRGRKHIRFVLSRRQAQEMDDTVTRFGHCWNGVLGTA